LSIKIFELGKDIKLEKTADGSFTLYVPDLDEHYHSVNGAVAESQHVYILAGLSHYINTYFQKNQPDNKECKDEIQLLEFGFGTGLNAFLTALEAEKKKIRIIYTALEKFPLSQEITNQLNYGIALKEPCHCGLDPQSRATPCHCGLDPQSRATPCHCGLDPQSQDSTQLYYHEIPRQARDDSLYQKIHKTNWESQVEITTYFTLEKKEINFLDFDFPNHYDIVYYDAFAPDKQPEVWSQELFNKLFSAMNPGGVLTTYCAKGTVRRMMKQAGFYVERIQGAAGKREMLRSFKQF